MRRLMMRVITGFTVGLLVSGYLMTVRQGKHIATAQAGLPKPDNANGIAAVLLKKLAAGSGFLDFLDAPGQSLALGGVATWNGKSAVAPAASTRAIPKEVANLALEANQRATAETLGLARLGHFLRDMGWPFKSGSTPANGSAASSGHGGKMLRKEQATGSASPRSSCGR